MSSRKILEWTDWLQSGDYAIDAQTKNYLRQSNDFIDSMDYASAIDKLDALLSFLTDYSREHFTLQSKMMTDTNYPSKSAHEQDHANFIRNLSKLYKMLMNCKKNIDPSDSDYDPRGYEGVIADTYNFIYMWYEDHMLVSDKKFYEYLKFEQR